MATKRSSVPEDVSFTIKIPGDSMEMIELAARAQGWAPQVPDDLGGMRDNPISAPMQLFITTVQLAAQQATNEYARIEADKVREEARTLMDAKRDAMIAAVRGENAA